MGAIIQFLNAEVGPALVLSYDDWRPSREPKHVIPVSRSENEWRVQTVEAASEVVESERFEPIARVVVHHPLLWEDGSKLARRLKAAIDFVVHVDLSHVANICNRVLPPHYALLEARIIEEADRVLALSEDVATRWRSHYPNVSIRLTPLFLGRCFEETEAIAPWRILSVGRFDMSAAPISWLKP